MIDAWWLAAALAVGIITGSAGTLVLAALIRTAPMDGRTYTGDLPADLRDDA